MTDHKEPVTAVTRYLIRRALIRCNIFQKQSLLLLRLLLPCCGDVIYPPQARARPLAAADRTAV